MWVPLYASGSGGKLSTCCTALRPVRSRLVSPLGWAIWICVTEPSRSISKLTAGGLRSEHCGVPLRGYLLVDLLDVVSEFGAEGGVGYIDAGGAGAGLDAAHGNPDTGAFAGLHLVGLDLDRLWMQRRRRRGLVRELRGLGGLDRDGDRVGLGYVDGFRRGRDGRGRWVIRGEDIVLIHRRLGRQRDVADHGGLDGAGGGGSLAPALPGVRDIRPGEEQRGRDCVQCERACQSSAEPAIHAGEAIAADCDVGSQLASSR